MKLKAYNLDYIIIWLLTLVLLVDMLTGYLKLSNSSFEFPLSQFYKLFLLFMVLFRLQKQGKVFLALILLYVVLMLPSVFQMFMGGRTALFQDSLKIVKYLTPFVFFNYFRTVFFANNSRVIIFCQRLITISFFILTCNVLLKLIGLGYPIYPYGELGSKGYFFAGNEISSLLLILYSLVSFELLLKGKKYWFWAIFLYSLITGFLLGSKTGIFGIVLIMLLLVISPARIVKSINKMSNFLIATVLIAPVALIFFINKFVATSVYQNRILFYAKEMDLFTLILSSRNVYLANAHDVFNNNYNLGEKIIGVGQTNYVERVVKTVEMDFFDILFTYGYLGGAIFLILFFFLILDIRRAKSKRTLPYARLSLMMAVFILALSTITGHTFSSGMAGIFLGFIFAIHYKKSRG